MIAGKTLCDLTFCYIFYLMFVRYILHFPYLLHPHWSLESFYTLCSCALFRAFILTLPSAWTIYYVPLPQRDLSEHHWKFQLGIFIIYVLLDPLCGKVMLFLFNVVLNTFYILFDVLGCLSCIFPSTKMKFDEGRCTCMATLFTDLSQILK